MIYAVFGIGRKGGVLLRRFERSTSSTADSERKRRLGVLLAIYISFWQETKNSQK